MELPEVECVFDTSRSIYCLKPKGSHVGLSGDEIEEVARRCNSHEKFKDALEWIKGATDIDEDKCKCGRPTGVLAIHNHAKRALKEAEKQCPPVK